MNPPCIPLHPQCARQGPLLTVSSSMVVRQSTKGTPRMAAWNRSGEGRGRMAGGGWRAHQVAVVGRQLPPGAGRAAASRALHGISGRRSADVAQCLQCPHCYCPSWPTRSPGRMLIAAPMVSPPAAGRRGAAGADRQHAGALSATPLQLRRPAQHALRSAPQQLNPMLTTPSAMIPNSISAAHPTAPRCIGAGAR